MKHPLHTAKDNIVPRRGPLFYKHAQLMLTVAYVLLLNDERCLTLATGSYARSRFYRSYSRVRQRTSELYAKVAEINEAGNQYAPPYEYCWNVESEMPSSAKCRPGHCLPVRRYWLATEFTWDRGSWHPPSSLFLCNNVTARASWASVYTNPKLIEMAL